MYRFLLSPRWLGFAVFVVALAGICLQLGVWQFHKLEQRKDDNAQVREHLAVDPVPLDDVVPAGSTVTKDLQWTQVTVTGEYDVEHEVTVKFLNRDSQPGVDVVTPLVLDDGTAVLVDRGFLSVPQRDNKRPEDIPAPPDGTVEVSGWLRVDNGAGDSATKVSDGQVRAVSSRGLAEHVPYELRNGFLNLTAQSPETEGLAAEPRPDLGQGPHFFYGLQWWFFTILALVGYVWFARAEALERRRRADRPPSRAQASETSSA